MSSISVLQAAFAAKIEAISDDLLKAKATCVLDDYVAASTALKALSAKTMDNYSIAGHTFSFRNLPALKKHVDGLEADLLRLIYGNTRTSSVVMAAGWQEGVA